MRAVLQRVTSARVRVDGATVGEIGRGLLVLLGVARGDTAADAAAIAAKIVGLRVFEDDAGKMNLAVADVQGSVLVVSQFTLLGDCRGGKRPSYIDAAPLSWQRVASSGMACSSALTSAERSPRSGSSTMSVG